MTGFWGIMIFKAITGKTDGKPIRQLKLNRSTKRISDIIAEQSAKSGISQKLLRSGSRRRNISQSRAVIAKRCTDEPGMTFADIAGALGVTTSAIRRLFGVLRKIIKHVSIFQKQRPLSSEREHCKISTIGGILNL
jgi:hypothetical protein